MLIIPSLSMHYIVIGIEKNYFFVSFVLTFLVMACKKSRNKDQDFVV